MEYLGIKDQKPLILIVDDNHKNLQVLGTMLSKRDYRIAVATSGAQALSMIDEMLPDLVLLDIMMPEMDGFEVCKRIKEKKSTKELPVIFITAKAGSSDIVKGLACGAVDYVVKPFNSAELLARVNTHIELKRSRDVLAKALKRIKTLSGLLPICAHCKNIRDDDGYWQEVEEFVTSHSNAEFSHSICPDCMELHYPDIAEKILHKEDD